MQKIASRVFMIASVAFGILGILIVLTTKDGEGDNVVLIKLFMTTDFIILTSFALSVAGKYLEGT